MSKHEDEVCKKIQQRTEVGMKKYGVTMERTDLNTHEWLTHLQEELMDAAVYVERLMSDMEVMGNKEKHFLIGVLMHRYQLERVEGYIPADMSFDSWLGVD